MPNLKDSKAYSGFSTNDSAKAKAFYGETLGLDVSVENDMVDLALATGAHVLIYPKPNHVPAEYTTLNFPVTDIEATVDELAAAGIEFERYEGMNQDKRGIAHNEGPLIAWFKDPAGNILSVIEE
jgi:catechol 2,3-dioxygenase-like lactoylglutathione lyase family enzyme